MRRLTSFASISTLVAGLPLFAGIAMAEPLPGSNIAALDNSEVRVVQEVLYQKAGGIEASISFGLVPNDPYVLSAGIGIAGTYHHSETLGFELTGTLLQGKETSESLRLSDFGLAVDSYSPLFQGGVSVLWSPIYAKMNLLGHSIVHYDLYLIGGAGLYLAQRTVLAGVSGDGGDDLAQYNSPVSAHIGLGQRFFFRPGDKLQNIKLEIRDHLYRTTTPEGENWVKHNVHLTAGWGMFF